MGDILSPDSVVQKVATLRGLARARETLRGITGLHVIEEKARVEDGRITEFLVTLQVIFVLEESDG